MQYGVEHPVGPLQAPAGQLPNSLEDRVAVAVPFGQDREDDRGRGKKESQADFEAWFETAVKLGVFPEGGLMPSMAFDELNEVVTA